MQDLFKLPALRAAGFALALDDFGSGDSALACLSHPGLGQIKLARPLVQSLRPDSRALRRIAALTELAHAEGLRVIAKGVEQGSQVKLLWDLGVDGLLGQHLAPAMDAEAFAGWLRER